MISNALRPAANTGPCIESSSLDSATARPAQIRNDRANLTPATRCVRARCCMPSSDHSTRLLTRLSSPGSSTQRRISRPVTAASKQRNVVAQVYCGMTPPPACSTLRSRLLASHGRYPSGSTHRTAATHPAPQPVVQRACCVKYPLPSCRAPGKMPAARRTRSP